MRFTNVAGFAIAAEDTVFTIELDKWTEHLESNKIETTGLSQSASNYPIIEEWEYAGDHVVRTTKTSGNIVTRQTIFGRLTYSDKGELKKLQPQKIYQMSYDPQNKARYGEVGTYQKPLPSIHWPSPNALKKFGDSYQSIQTTHQFDEEDPDSNIGLAEQAFTSDEVKSFYAAEWYLSPFSTDLITASVTNSPTQSDVGTVNNAKALKPPEKFNKKSADKITNFNPSTDILEIDSDSFGIVKSPTFATGATKKEVKKVLTKQDFDFLYDQKKGGLYFNENGSAKGFGDGGIIAILKGAPELTSGNLEFI